MEPDPSSRKQAVAMGFIFMAGVAMLLLQWPMACDDLQLQNGRHHSV
jgi:hypothetical protein